MSGALEAVNSDKEGQVESIVRDLPWELGLTHFDKDKWQQMLLCVNQHSQLLQPNLKWQYKKLFVQRVLFENIFVFLLQYSGLNLTTLYLSASPLWLATGTACAFLFLRGYSILPGIGLGTFLAYYLAKAGFWLAFASAVVIPLQAMLLRLFNYKYLCPTLIFHRLSHYIKFILFTTALTALSSSLLLLIYSLLSNRIISLQLWLQWWLGNLNAILIFSCALLTWDSYFPSCHSIKQLKKTILLAYASLVLITLLLACSRTPTATLSFALSNLALTILISANLGWGGAITATCLSGMMLSLAAFMNAAVFNTTFVAVTFPSVLQLFLAVETIIAVSLAIKCEHVSKC